MPEGKHPATKLRENMKPENRAHLNEGIVPNTPPGGGGTTINLAPDELGLLKAVIDVEDEMMRNTPDPWTQEGSIVPGRALSFDEVKELFERVAQKLRV